MASETPTRVRTPRARGRKLRAAILQQASELASLDGLDQVSIGRLAAAMDMSKSGLYAYFTSKEDLQLATIDRAWAVFEEHVLAPADDTVEALVERWLSYYEREVFPGGCLFATATGPCTTRSPRRSTARSRRSSAPSRWPATAGGCRRTPIPASSASSCTPCSPRATSTSGSGATRSRSPARARRSGGCCG
jgi:AcrR family transcriptional regulator